MPAGHDDLVQRLRTGDMTERLRAAEELASAGGDGAVEPLARALEDGDWRVRWLAADTLGKLGVASAAEPLCDVLREREPADSRFAADALVELGALAVAAVLRLAQGGSAAAAAEAQDVLRRIAGSDELPEVVLRDERMPLRERLLTLHALHEAGWRRPVRKALERYGRSLTAAMAYEVAEARRIAGLLRPATDPGVETLLRPATGAPGTTEPSVLVRPCSEPTRADEGAE